MGIEPKKPSKLWYLFPIILGIFITLFISPLVSFAGGLLGYQILKNRNAKIAKKLMYIGFIFTASCFIFLFAYLQLTCTGHMVFADYVTYENDTSACKELCSKKFNVTSLNIVTFTQENYFDTISRKYINSSSYLCFCDLNNCNPE